jgi:branched-chain amino acid transport system substrate-binding protein
MRLLMTPKFSQLFSALTVASLLVSQQAKAEPILIGQTFVQTGPLASLSEQPLLGIKAKITAVNAAGGVNGRLIELRQVDDGADTTKAAENVKKLIADGAIAILMPIGTISSLGALQAANELKVPLIAPYTGAASAVKFSEYGFNVRISFDEEFERIVNHLFTIGIKNIAFAHNDNPGARLAMEGTKRAIEGRGSKMVGSVAIKNDASDADVQAAALVKLKPTAIAMSATTPVAAKFIQAYKKAGGEASFYVSSFTNGQQLFKMVGKDAVGVVVSQVVPYPWNAATTVVGEYQAAMKKIGLTEFSYGSLEGFINAGVLVEALKRSGSKPTPASIKKALESFNPINLGGIYIKYSGTDHDGLTFSELSMVKSDGGYLK